ncbi:hypothetical protein COO59_09250 [Mixta theicola]|uniref:Uncharacterized protein n=1 Tax=Mixta theicola TaxID=1458355 RepID=A0A2K1QAV1_9GAMM|nr:hypothetical protein COO59_09250 [Mixta theicola]
MSKLYAREQELSVMLITKIALPKTNIQNCDSAIKVQSSQEFTAKKEAQGVYS